MSYEGCCQPPNPITRQNALRPSFYDSPFHPYDRRISVINHWQSLLAIVELPLSFP
jgi:hypothetical protein